MLRIKNWEKFQHYKDRNPPWIKLHYEVMTSQDWVALADASKLLAVVCMMVASRHDGCVPDNPEYVKRVAYLDKLPDFKPLIKSGFLVKVLADASECKQAIADARPETETEKKEYMSEFLSFWEKYPRKEKRRDAERAYAKAVKKSTHDEIMDGLSKYLQNKPSYADWAHPTSWLNGERWNDDYASKVSQIPQTKSKNLVIGSPEWKEEMGIAQ